MVMVSEGVRAARMFKARFDSDELAAPFVSTVVGLLDNELDIDGFLTRIMTT